MPHTRHDASEGAATVSPQRQRIPLELYLLGVGLLLCIGIATRGRFIAGDRFSYPKEFALQFFALLVAVTAVGRVGALRIGRLDGLLLAFLGWNAIAAIGAPNHWWAYNAVGATAASLAVFWVTRALRDQGHERALLGLVALAVTVVAGAAVLEAYGLYRVSIGTRAPGGVLGSRNQMAHALVLGTPTLLLFAIGLRRRLMVALTAVAITAITIALVLSRTRGAWLSALVSAGWVLLTLPLTRHALREAVSRRRVALWIGAALVGAAAALLLPNALEWRSVSPYRSTWSRMLEFDAGTGRGRLLQQANTVRMIRDHPVLGVGPGNWSVRYAKYAPPGDPTHKPTHLTPVWRYPNGEWIGTAAEVGLPGAAMLLLAGGLFLRSAWRRVWRRKDAESVLRGLTLGCTLIPLVLIGLLDPVIRVPAGGFLVFMILGVLAPRERSWLSLDRLGLSRGLRVACVVLGLGPGVAFAGSQLGAALMYSNQATPARLARAIAIHPGDYRAHVLLATAWVKQGRCDLARPHIKHALRLYPSAEVPAQLHLQCAGVLTGGP